MNMDSDLGRGIADLHMHTTASDGTVDVGRRLEMASNRGLEAIAITDHDILSKDLSRPTETRNGVELVAGVEVRADLFDIKVEILGYFVDPNDDRLQSVLQQAREFRRHRNEEMVSAIADATGLDLSYEKLAESVDGTLGRPHLADHLIEKGIVDSVGEAFDYYLAEEGEAFVPMQRLPATEVISTINEAGGVTSLAHPGRIRTEEDTVERMVERLSQQGLDGIEVWYPYGDIRSDDYATIGVKEAATLADRFDLIPTGGSDCHGPGSGKFRIGKMRVPIETLDRIEKRARTRKTTPE